MTKCDKCRRKVRPTRVVRRDGRLCRRCTRNAKAIDNCKNAILDSRSRLDLGRLETLSSKISGATGIDEDLLDGYTVFLTPEQLEKLKTHPKALEGLNVEVV